MRITGLWRHPVKSMQGRPVETALVGPRGMVGDRAWGVRDVVTGALLSAKRESRLLLAAAEIHGEGLAVAVPGHGSVGGSAVDAALSEWLGRPVRVELAPEAAYVDEADLHVLTTGELGPWDVRRFRPNVVVDAPGALDHLVGERLRLGSVVVEVVKRTKRCAMPTMRQPGLDKDIDVLRTLARGRDLRLGVYAHVVSAGTLEVGAPITMA